MIASNVLFWGHQQCCAQSDNSQSAQQENAGSQNVGGKKAGAKKTDEEKKDGAPPVRIEPKDKQPLGPESGQLAPLQPRASDSALPRSTLGPDPSLRPSFDQPRSTSGQPRSSSQAGQSLQPSQGRGGERDASSWSGQNSSVGSQVPSVGERPRIPIFQRENSTVPQQLTQPSSRHRIALPEGDALKQLRQANERGLGHGAVYDGSRPRRENAEDEDPRKPQTPFFNNGTNDRSRAGQLSQPESEKSRSITAPDLRPDPTGRSSQPAQAGVAERVLRRKLGSEAVDQLLRATDRDSTQGTSSTSLYDYTRRRALSDDSHSGGASYSTRGVYNPPTVESARETTGTYGSIPGGIVLEGIATGLDQFKNIEYDRRFEAFTLDDDTVYMVNIPSASVAALCRAIAEDDKVGVSLGEKDLVYGHVDRRSQLAWDLKLADHFLGDIVFARNDWTRGYKFPDGFTPKSPRARLQTGIAVFFKFKGFDFQIQEEEAIPHTTVEVQILPLSKSKSAEGGHLPDSEAIEEGRTVEEFVFNAKHVADNISYYRQERIVDQVVNYGAAAAFLRKLKQSGANLETLARTIEGR